MPPRKFGLFFTALTDCPLFAYLYAHNSCIPVSAVILLEFLRRKSWHLLHLAVVDCCESVMLWTMRQGTDGVFIYGEDDEDDEDQVQALVYRCKCVIESYHLLPSRGMAIRNGRRVDKVASGGRLCRHDRNNRVIAVEWVR
ncbi:hypothetical protein B0T13DRAFT_502765 [Neurospora crassa]|nr:hypothetical protein B0T13DRAFT_502765 [Neurospora crassa]